MVAISSRPQCVKHGCTNRIYYSLHPAVECTTELFYKIIATWIGQSIYATDFISNGETWKKNHKKCSAMYVLQYGHESLTYWNLNNITDIWHMMFLNAFSWKKIFVIWLKFQCSLSQVPLENLNICVWSNKNYPYLWPSCPLTLKQGWPLFANSRCSIDAYMHPQELNMVCLLL